MEPEAKIVDLSIALLARTWADRAKRCEAEANEMRRCGADAAAASAAAEADTWARAVAELCAAVRGS